MFSQISLRQLFIAAISLTLISLLVTNRFNPVDYLSLPVSIESNIAHIRSTLTSISSFAQCPSVPYHAGKYSALGRKLSDQQAGQYAYIHVLDLNLDVTFQLYGILAFHGGLQRTQSRHHHIIMVPQTQRASLHAVNTPSKIAAVINALQTLAAQTQTTGNNNKNSELQLRIIAFDSTPIDEALESNAHHSQLRDTFHAAHAFKNIAELQAYHKLCLVQYNMVILGNSMDVVFNYPAPSAPPERWSGLESNIACFVYTLKHHNRELDVYDIILQRLRSNVYVWYNDDENQNKHINDNAIKWDTDAWNTERGTFQSLLNAIYWSREYGLNGVHQMHQKFAVSTNKLSNRRTKYFVEHRRHMLYAIEFVDDYPPTSKARDRCIVRTEKMVKPEYKLDWFEIAMNTYFVQFWLDLHRICSDTNNNEICQTLNFQYGPEINAALSYQNKHGYPFP